MQRDTSSRKFHFWLAEHYPKRLGDQQGVLLSNVRQILMFFFVSTGYHLETVPWISFLTSCGIVNTDLIWGEHGSQLLRSSSVRQHMYCFQIFLFSHEVFILGCIVACLCTATMPLWSCMGIHCSAFSFFTFLQKYLKAGRKLPGGYTHFTSRVCGVVALWEVLIMGEKTGQHPMILWSCNFTEYSVWCWIFLFSFLFPLITKL